MSNGQPYYGDDQNSTANSSGGGFGGATMGGHGYAGQRPQFGQPQPGMSQPDYAQGTNPYPPTQFMQDPQLQHQVQPPNPSETPTPPVGYSYATYNNNNSTNNNGPPTPSPGYPQTPSSQGIQGLGGGHGYPAGMGSVTRFATTTPPTQGLQPQQPQGGPGTGTPLYHQASPYNFQPPPQPAAPAAVAGANMAGMSFAQRSAMLQQQQQQQHQVQPQNEQGVYGQPPPQQQQQAQRGYQGLQSPPLAQQSQPPVKNVQQRVQQPPGNMAGLSFAQRSAMLRQSQPPPPAGNVYGGPQQQQQQQQQQQFQPPQPPQTLQNYGTPYVAVTPSNVYSPPRRPQQPPQAPYGQPPLAQPQQPMSGSMMNQGSVMSYQQQQQQQQQPQYQGTMPGGGVPTPQQQLQQQPGMPSQQLPGDSFAQRSAMMSQSQTFMPSQQQQQVQQPQYGGGATNMPPPQQQQSGMFPPMQQQQQQQLMSGQPPMPQQPPPPMPNIYVDPPEVIAQQNRLLTDATRKVQEHAYYMKQAMERQDLPTVLDRAAQMVGELGEHAHAHHHHHSHPPAPGASGSTTALSPKNYYELHLRALEELPTLEDYLLAVAQGSGGVGTQPPLQQQQQQQLFGTMAPGTSTMNNGMMMMAPPPPNGTTTGSGCTMRELYDYVQYCPNVLSRLYLQICAASALIRSGEVGTRWVLKDIIEAVKCVQNPVRGLFLRHYLLQAIRDKLPNEPILPTEVVPYGMAPPPSVSSGSTSTTAQTPGPVVAAEMNDMEKGTVKDSYEFILANFIQMNKLWVRIKHLPGDVRSKDIRRRREKDRNELRILVGTNLVRLSALDSVTSQIYGQVILPTVLDHIIISEDPLAQAYLIDCIVQVFPDEYHIETMPILLAACPKLRDKVNIRTILHSLMERLANYLADEELLDEADSNQVKRQMAQDSFRMMDECVQSVYNARGPKLQAKEVIRLQTALLSFSMKCYRGNLEQITLCLDNCVVALQQARANQALMQESRNVYMDPNAPRVLPQLEEVATKELETLLSIPLEELALGVLTLDHYANLIGFLPWANRRQVALTMLEAVSKAGKSPTSMKEIEELFSVIAPVLREEHENIRGQNTSQMQMTTNLMAGLGVSYQPPFGQADPGMPIQEDPQYRKDAALVSKLIHLLHHQDTDIHFQMLEVARNHLNGGRMQRTGSPFIALVFAGLNLAKRIVVEAVKVEASGEDESKKDTQLDEGGSKSNAGETAATEGEHGTESGDKIGTDEGVVAASDASTIDVTVREANRGTTEKSVTSRRVFVFVQETIAVMAQGKPEIGVKLYLESALTADKLASKNTTGQEAFGPIAYEFISQSFALYEEHAGDSRLQSHGIVAMVGTLLACRSLIKEDYETLVMKVAQYSAKMLRKPEQCAMVAQCSHLFYVVSDDGDVAYSNPPRSLECLQRALKLADACTNSNPANAYLFVDLLEHYLFFFEKNHPAISGNYITGLVALIKEHTESLGKSIGDAKAHFAQIVAHIKAMKEKDESKERFSAIDVGTL